MLRKITALVLGTALVTMLFLAVYQQQDTAMSDRTPSNPISTPSVDAGENDNNDTSATTDKVLDSSKQRSGAEVSLELVDHQSTSEEPAQYIHVDNKRYPLRTYQPLMLPNDPLANQWWVDDATFEQAWAIPRGDHETLLAVIDGGFALEHEEFANRWHVNTGESGSAASENPSTLNCTDRGLAVDATCNLIDDNYNGIVDDETGAAIYENPSQLNCTGQGKPLTKDCNRIDDDTNGHVDDVTGWDFISNDSSVQAGELNPAGEGTTHGTLVAGVAAATGNNAKGIAGADWGTKILPLQALDDDSYGNSLTVGRSIYYAVEQGADVISISLGTAYQDGYVREAVEAATAAGIVVVASSGNDGCDCIVYPANYPEVVAVGALNTSNTYADFSSWGAELDILAPGTNITSPTWTQSNQTSAYGSGLAGTSFSAPMIAGIFTTLISHQPDAVPLQLIAAVTENTNRLSLSPSAPHHTRHGFGTLDAHKATLRMTNPRNMPFTYAFTPVKNGGYLQPSQPVEALAQYQVHDCTPGIPTTPIYELVKLGSTFFTISKVEARQAQGLAYNSSLFAYGCVQQPHDTIEATRNIDLFKEFRNVYTKL